MEEILVEDDADVEVVYVDPKLEKQKVVNQISQEIELLRALSKATVPVPMDYDMFYERAKQVNVDFSDTIILSAWKKAICKQVKHMLTDDPRSIFFKRSPEVIDLTHSVTPSQASPSTPPSQMSPQNTPSVSAYQPFQSPTSPEVLSNNAVPVALFMNAYFREKNCVFVGDGENIVLPDFEDYVPDVYPSPPPSTETEAIDTDVQHFEERETDLNEFEEIGRTYQFFGNCDEFSDGSCRKSWLCENVDVFNKSDSDSSTNTELSNSIKHSFRKRKQEKFFTSDSDSVTRTDLSHGSIKHSPRNIKQNSSCKNDSGSFTNTDLSHGRIKHSPRNIKQYSSCINDSGSFTNTDLSHESARLSGKSRKCTTFCKSDSDSLTTSNLSNMIIKNSHKYKQLKIVSEQKSTALTDVAKNGTHEVIPSYIGTPARITKVKRRSSTKTKNQMRMTKAEFKLFIIEQKKQKLVEKRKLVEKQLEKVHDRLVDVIIPKYFNKAVKKKSKA